MRRDARNVEYAAGEFSPARTVARAGPTDSASHVIMCK